MEETTGEAPGSVYDHSLAFVGTKLFLFGGYGSNVRLVAARFFSFSQSSYFLLLRACSDNQISVSLFQCYSLSNMLTILVHVQGTLNNRLASFDTKSNTWTQLGSEGAPSARAGHGFAASATKLFVQGGITMVGNDLITLNDLYEYDVGAGMWTKLAMTVGDLPTTRYFYAFVSAQDSLFILGGLSRDGSGADSRVVKYGSSMRCAEECMPGTFRQISELTGVTSCIDCSAGKFSSKIAAPRCDSCPAGIISDFKSSACT